MKKKDEHFLVANRISRIYDGRYVLKKFSYVFPSHGLVGIIGPSGCGKSTLLNLLSLLDKPDEGFITFMGSDINKWKDNRKLKYRSEDIGIIFQHYNLLENETAQYNVCLPLLINGGSKKETYRKSVSLLESISFKKELYKERACNLSGGEKERIAILRALINNPKIILADEPTGALDSDNSELIMKMLKGISKERLVVVVSHNLKLINKYASVLLTVKDGILIGEKRGINE